MIYFTVTIDTECDKGPAWKTQYPLSFTAVTSAIPDFFQPLFDKYKIKPTYLLSPEILRNEECVNVLKETKHSGAELGTHLHGEFIEPEANFKTATTIRMQNSYTKEIEYQKLRNLTEVFEQKFGFRPKSFRAGRYGLSSYTLKFLVELGYKVDSSIVPNTIWKDDGGMVEFFGAPRQPYYPHSQNFKKRGDLPILEVPISMSYNWYDFFPNPVLNTIPSFQFFWKIPRMVFQEKFQTLMLRPTLRSGSFENMKSIVEKGIDQNRKKNVFFIMMFHNVDFWPGCSPYATNKTDTRIFYDRLVNLLNFCQSLNVQFVTLSDIHEKVAN